MRTERQSKLDHRDFPILYVDDEPENLRTFELTFKREFKVLTATSGPDALDILNSTSVALLLSDHRMPGMTGVEFLSLAKDIDPKTIRMLVTAYGDAETLQAAINNGAIYRFIPKPWTPDEMRITLRRGIEVFALEQDRTELVRELTLLNRVSKRIGRELALDPLMDLLIDTMIQEFGFDGAGLLLFDSAGKVLSWGRLGPRDSEVTAELEGREFHKERASEFVARLKEGAPITLSLGEALGLEAPIRDWVTEVAADQILVVPLLGKDRVIGAVAVDNRRGGRCFNGSDRMLLEGLAGQAVTAIQNARLVEDLRRSHEQVLRTDRLGTLGTMAAGLAHEISNPLASIQTFLSMAPDRRYDDDSDFWTDYHALTSKEVERIHRLVDTMRRIGCGGSDGAQREAFDVGELLFEVVGLLKQEARRAQVALQVECESDLPKLVAVRDQVQQVVLNLVKNAMQASMPMGEVRLRAFAVRSDEILSIEISDNGSGVSEENLNKIFEPFFTTKGPDQGSGLGLMICHRIVSEHGGSIEVLAREGEGATFRVRLPTSSDSGAGATTSDG